MALATDTQLQLAQEQFTNILKLRLQQERSVFRGLVTEGSHVGKTVSPVQYMSPFAMEPPVGVFAPGNIVQPGYMRRWLSGVPAEKFLGIDSFDQLQTSIDPQSQLVTASAAAVARFWDDQVITAAFGSATIGTDPASYSTETWASVNSGLVVAVTFDDGSTATGMTIAKLREARRIFRHNHALDNPGTRMRLALGSQQEDDLLALTQIVNIDYNPVRDGVPVMETGQVTHFLGFDFCFSERLQVVSSNTRGTFAFVEDGLYLGIWKDLETYVFYGELVAGRPLVVHPMTMVGATRLEPGRLVEIDCHDTTGLDNI